MLVLRYIYVLALVVWLGGMLVLGATAGAVTFTIGHLIGGATP